MKSVFDPAVRQELVERVGKLSVNSPRVFGTMRPEQGLHHINSAFQAYLGELNSPYHGNNFMASVLRLFTFSPMPIPPGKGKTTPPLISEGVYDIEAEKLHFQDLLDRVGSRRNTKAWPIHAVFGKLTGDQYGKLGYKHTDHHLKQFGV